MMQTLPRELLDEVIQQLAEHAFPNSARFPVLTAVSRQAILSARLVGRGFRDSTKLKELFIVVLEETPFMWHRYRMPQLIKVSRSDLAGEMKTLTLCGMSLDSWHEDEVPAVQSDRRETRRFPRDLMPVLQRFVHVKHLRYYAISPKCFQDWPGRKPRVGTGPVAQWGYLADDAMVQSWLQEQEDPSWVYIDTMMGVVDAGLALESVTFPLYGNRASYCGIQVTSAYFPSALKRLTISLTDRLHDSAIFEPWLGALRSLTFLEVAISRNPNSLGPWNSFANCRRLTDVERIDSCHELPMLEEIRLMTDNQICFSERDLLQGLNLFPRLRKLGLAHTLIKSQLNNADSWGSFIRRLVARELERLWLLDPRNLWTDWSIDRAGHYKMKKYRLDDDLRAVAGEVRLIDTNSLWAENTEPVKRRDFKYPGFAVFEQI